MDTQNFENKSISVKFDGNAPDTVVITPTIQRQDVTPDIFPDGRELVGLKEGVVVGARSGQLMRDQAEGHKVIMGTTGTNKGVGFIIPNLLTHPGSVFSVEISGTSYRMSANYRRTQLHQNVYVFDPHKVTGEETASYNILDRLDPIHSETFSSDCEEIARCIMTDWEGNKSLNNFFDYMPRHAIKAMIMYVCMTYNDPTDLEHKAKRNLPYVADLFATYGTDKWNELMRKCSQYSGKFRQQINELGDFYLLKESNITKDGVIATAKGLIEFARDPKLAPLMRTSTANLSDISKGKTSIYIVMQNATLYEQFNPWLRLMIEGAIASCPNASNGPAVPCDKRVLFLLDEFTHLGKLDCVTKGMQTSRQQGIVLCLVFQNYPELKKIYGDDEASSILAGASCIMAYGVFDPVTAQLISERAGNNIVHIPTCAISKGRTESQTHTKGQSQATGTQHSERHGDSFGKTSGRVDGSSTTNSRSSGTSYSSGHGTSNTPNSTETTKSQHESIQFQNGKSQAYTETHQTSSGSSETTSYDITKGTQETNTKNESDADTFGKNEGITLQTATQVLPRLSVSDVLGMLGNGSRQILFLKGKEKAIIEEAAPYYKVPTLKARAKGPKPQKFGEFTGPLELPEPIRVSVPDVGTNLSLPQPPIETLTFYLLPEPELPSGSDDLQVINQIDHQIQLTKRAASDIRRDISNKTSAAFNYEKGISTAYNQIVEEVNSLTAAQGDILAYRDKLQQFKDLLDYQSKDDANLRSSTENYKQYLDYYYRLREDIWNGMREPTCPDVERVKPWIFFARKQIDPCFLELPQVSEYPPRIPIKPELMSQVFPFNFPTAPNIQEIVRGAKIKVNGNLYTLVELDEKIKATSMTPSARLKQPKASFGLLKSILGGNSSHPLTNAGVFDPAGTFKKARSTLLNHIRKESETAFKSYFNSILEANRQITSGELCMDIWYQSLLKMPGELQDTVNANYSHAEQLKKDIVALSSKRDDLNTANNTLAGNRAEIFWEVAHWDIWKDFKAQTQRLGPIEEAKELDQQESSLDQQESNLLHDMAFNGVSFRRPG